MAQSNKKKTNKETKKSRALPTFITIVVCILLVGVFSLGGVPNVLIRLASGENVDIDKELSSETIFENFTKNLEKLFSVSDWEDENKKDPEDDKRVTNDGELSVYYISCGNADSILIESNSHFILVDTGDNGTEDEIIDFLKSKNVSTIDYLILTHPHADHIGGAVEIINAFKINEVLMPEAENKDAATYRKTVELIEDKNIKSREPKAGEWITWQDATIQIIGRIGDFGDNLNNSSIVFRLLHGDNVFLFMGDCEQDMETKIREAGYSVKCDVLKVGHHGSNTASSYMLIKEASPEYAVISCGKNNKFGHPHEQTLSRLEQANVEVFRTDEDGTVWIVSDGEKIDVVSK